jgi:hypothetical protein
MVATGADSEQVVCLDIIYLPIIYHVVLPFQILVSYFSSQFVIRLYPDW